MNTKFICFLHPHVLLYTQIINPPRNREAGYPRAGRYVADPDAREKIREVVEQWVNI